MSDLGLSKAELLAAGPGWSHALAVHFQDIDAAGIVYYPRILSYFHDAYVAFLAAHGCSLAEALKTRSFLAPIKHAEADFMAPMRFGDQVDVALVRARLEGSVLTVGFRASVDGRPTAVGHSVHVFVDAGFQRAAPPAAIVAAFAGLAGPAGG